MIIPLRIDGTSRDSTDGRETSSCRRPEESTDNAQNGVPVRPWSMIELQGELVSKEPLSRQKLGRMTSEDGKPVLIISNHKLEGKSAAESKPLLVLKKVVVGGGDPHDGVQTDRRKTERGKRVEYKIVGSITKKFIFKTRPKPLIRKGS